MILITWNMQGSSHSIDNKWNTGVLNMFSKLKADVVALQECGSIPSSAKLFQKNAGGNQGLNVYYWGTQRSGVYITFYPWDSGGNRCNLALVSRAKPTDFALIYPKQKPVWRPGIGIVVNKAAFFSIHAISPNGPDVKGLLNAIFSAASGKFPTAVAGDFNREPNSFQIGVICPPNGNTYSATNPKKMLDYCVLSTGVSVKGAVINMILSDHLPVGYNL